MEFIQYNREERDICAHLFRLLLEDQPNWGPLKSFLQKETVSNPRIFCEVATLRDAYFVRKPETNIFMNDVCDMIAAQIDVSDYTRYTDLNQDLNNPKVTHPKQIKMKMQKKRMTFSNEDTKVYGTLQAMFNAKPDLVICEGTTLYVYEAKYFMKFDEGQLNRTRQIAEVWAKLLFKDLGFSEIPQIQIKTLGLRKNHPNISWEDILDIAKRWLDVGDFSIKVFSKVLDNQ